VTVALFAGLFSAYGFTDAADPYQSDPQSATAPAKQPPHPWPRTVRAALHDFTAKATWTSWDAWTYSAGAATAIITDPEAQLTRAGRGFRVAIRILGLGLFGLAVLSLRGRVKR
jgi:hypothetical protein